MTAAAARPGLDHPDVTKALLLSRAYDFDARSELIEASIPSRKDSAVRYLVRGHTHGRDATCTCLGFTRWRRCCHQAAFLLIVEELERQFYAEEGRYSTAQLLDLARYFDAIADILSADQRLRFHGIKAALRDRGIRFEATRTLAEQRAVAERAAGAKAILFSEG